MLKREIKDRIVYYYRRDFNDAVQWLAPLVDVVKKSRWTKKELKLVADKQRVLLAARRDCFWEHFLFELFYN